MNKTIYVTPFKNSTKECSGPSVDSGFPSLDAAVGAIGPPAMRAKRHAIYGDGEDRVVFSDFIFHVDAGGSTG